MTYDRTLTLAYDEDGGQVVLEGLPGGPAGEAGLSLAQGIELLFDCADGRLSRVIIDAGEPGGPAEIGEPAMAAAASLFGARAHAILRQAPSRDGDPVTVTADPGTIAAMSRLARLDAARVTSPVADSPLWAVEAARLAWRAGLKARVTAETGSAMNALEGADDTSLTTLATAAGPMADLLQAAEPELARRLREHAVVPGPDGPAAARGTRGWSLALPDAAAERGQRSRDGRGLQWGLDPRLVPPGIFRHMLWPAAELTVRTEQDRIVVEAELGPGADRRKLARCRARLVDPVNRSVLGTAPFRDLRGSRVRAEIREPVPRGDAWVEVVDDETRPVLGRQLRLSRRAIRWADAALTAGRQAWGLADAGWVGLATAAWGRCAEDWSAAGDPDRAYLAAVRRTAAGPGAALSEEPSAWAKELAGRPLLAEEPFLAERADC